MSQIFKDLTAGPVPPSVATSYQAQNGANGTAVPAANILIVNGIDSTENNDNGLTVKGGVVGTGTANELDVVLTNRATGQVSTTDATPTTIITFALSDNTVYSVSGTVTCRDTTSGDGASYDFYGAFRRSGAGAVEIGTEYPTTFEDVSLSTADITVSASGNNVVLSVVGITANLNWDAILTFRQVA